MICAKFESMDWIAILRLCFSGAWHPWGKKETGEGGVGKEKTSSGGSRVWS